MKYFQIPDNVTVSIDRVCISCGFDGGQEPHVEEMSFRKWLEQFLDDKAFAASPKLIRISVKMLAKISEEDPHPGDFFGIEDSWYDELAKVVKKPNFAYHPLIARGCLVYWDEFEAAAKRDKKPSNGLAPSVKEEKQFDLEETSADA